MQLKRMSILVEDSAETVSPAYGEAFDPVGFKGVGSGSQGCCGGEGSVLVVVPLVHAQRVPEMGLVPDQHSV
jgi:hypothetical protein